MPRLSIPVTELEAGRELDAKVAVEVMGWRLHGDPGWGSRIIEGPHECGCPSHDEAGYVPNFSTDIAAAWPVLEHFTHPIWFEVGSMNDGTYYCEILQGGSTASDVHCLSHEHAPTAPLAICLAALKAVESK